jgi:hypothetical protein
VGIGKMGGKRLYDIDKEINYVKLPIDQFPSKNLGC